jgi:hypothetical protein
MGKSSTSRETLASTSGSVEVREGAAEATFPNRLGQGPRSQTGGAAPLAAEQATQETAETIHKVSCPSAAGRPFQL